MINQIMHRFLMGCSGNILGAPVSLGVDAVNAVRLAASLPPASATNSCPQSLRSTTVLRSKRLSAPFRTRCLTTDAS